MNYIDCGFIVLGCYIRAYQHYNKEGYSSICSDTAGCSVTPNEGALNGALTENTASSAYCYCDEPSKFIYICGNLSMENIFSGPKDCALIFMHDSEGEARFREGWAIIFDGFKLGYDYGLEEFDPVYVPNDALSSIYVSPGEYSIKNKNLYQVKLKTFKAARWIFGRIRTQEVITFNVPDRPLANGAIPMALVVLETMKRPQSNAHATKLEAD